MSLASQVSVLVTNIVKKIKTHVAQNDIVWVMPNANTTVLNVMGVAAPAATGTPTLNAIATTNFHTAAKRLDYLVTAAVTTAVAGFTGNVLQWWRGNAANLGGFYFNCRWGPATGVATTTNRAFVGLIGSVSAPTDVQPSSLLNIMGFGWDAADVNIQAMTNDGTGAATKTDLGVNFPVPLVDRTTVYDITLFCLPNSTTVTWTIKNMGTGAIATGTFSVDLPANTQLLTYTGWMSVGGTSSVIGISLMGVYIETGRQA